MKVEGKGHISATVVADSVNPWGDRVVTFQLHYPRFIHAEFMTHRMFSRNASSSRAIPVKRMLEYINDNPAMPIHWGENKAGMQADRELDPSDGIGCWMSAKNEAVGHAKEMAEFGYHKQIVNRLTEPFQFMNVVVTATDYDNFFYLRLHKDAQPEIQELARCMYEAYKKSRPIEIRSGEWHTPYVDRIRNDSGDLFYKSGDVFVSVDDAIKISASCCAQVSYRKNDTSLEKALDIYERLVGMTPKHASPFEHPCTPLSEEEHMVRVKIDHELDKHGIVGYSAQYCGNFRGWVQYRKTMADENITSYNGEWD